MMDVKEEQKYEQLSKLGRELHIPIPEAFLELEVRDKQGRVIQRHRQRSHSWVRNAYNHMFSALAAKDGDDDTFGAGKLNCKETDGTVRYGSNPIDYNQGLTVDGIAMGMRADAGDDTQGIVVGTGTNAESFEDYALQTKIASGTGAGQLAYTVHDAHAVSYTDTTLKNDFVRYFNNNSGGAITVNEVGIIARMSVGGSNYMILKARDKLATGVNVPDTGQLKVTYTVQLTYPA